MSRNALQLKTAKNIIFSPLQIKIWCFYILHCTVYIQPWIHSYWKCKVVENK